MRTRCWHHHHHHHHHHQTTTTRDPHNSSPLMVVVLASSARLAFLSFFLSFSLSHQSALKVFLLTTTLSFFSNFFKFFVPLHLGYQTTQNEPSCKLSPSNLHFSSRPHPTVHHEGTPVLFFFDRLREPARSRRIILFSRSNVRRTRDSRSGWTERGSRERARGAKGMRAFFWVRFRVVKKGRDARVLNPMQSEDAREKKREK